MRLSPGAGRAEFLIRHRFAVLTVAAVVIGVKTSVSFGAGSDFTFFRMAALVFTGHSGDVAPNLFFAGPTLATGPLDLYRDVPTVQIGPVPLAALTPVVLWLPQHLAVTTIAAISALALPLCLHLLEGAADEHLGRDDSRPVLVFTAGAACLLLWPSAFGRYVHPDDVLLLLAACAAVRAGVAGRWVSSAVLLGIAAGAKPWGLALLPVALLGSRGRRLVLAPAIAASTAALPWLPFVLGAPGTVDALSGFHIYVSSTAPLSLLDVGGQVPSWLRPLQIGVGALLVLFAVQCRLVLAGIAFAVAVRVSLEAQNYDYYFAVLAVATVGADLAVRGRRMPWATITVVLLVYDARWLVPNDWQVAVIQASLLPVVLGAVLLGPAVSRLRTPRRNAGPRTA
ncbi:glycosyltransferase 87 family protein [Kineococcus sp. NBC_00420]|uniref:glycosyltransferase 87 family protein n=1 Tax=Kineococcus sp. NBC_00420 TaxID=2903564 RepID=UPI002E1F2904